ncbi:MAG TPA: pyrroloquinoline quinone biosynthesis protein PqqB [Pseudolabrys sp.]|nr:pyrroloquinoline quinone biosynthesis protein PqqB [Pseudolabrys sp.]
MTAIILGSAAGGGFPQWNCRCRACALAWAGDRRVRTRTQTGIAVSANGSQWTLINASPDLGTQIRAIPSLQPQQGLRSSPIKAVVLTGGEIDQIAGLLCLRESTPFTLYATRATHAAVSANAVFGAMTAMVRRTIDPGRVFRLAGGIDAILFTVPGKPPLYLEGDDPETSADTPANVGIEMRYRDARLVIVPAAAAITEAMWARLRAADAVLYDGTLFRDDEMIHAGTGHKTARRMGHMPLDGDEGSLRALADLSGRRILIHINNTNPILIEDSPQRRMVEAAGWQVAEDGMEIVL